MFQCIESYVSQLKSENTILVDKVSRLDTEISQLQIQLNAVTEERDSFKAKVSLLCVMYVQMENCHYNGGGDCGSGLCVMYVQVENCR